MNKTLKDEDVIVSMADYDLIFTEPDSPVELLKQVLPSSLTLWLFKSDNTKWFCLETYKFGGPTITEDSLIDLAHNKEIVAFAYAMYRTNENEEGEWSSLCDSIRVIFGGVELKSGVLANMLRTRYLPILEIPSPDVYTDAPTFTLQSLRRPRVWIDRHQYTCRKCGKTQYVIRNSCNTGFCANAECDNFKLCTVTLESIDFESGPLNDLSDSIKTRRKHYLEDDEDGAGTSSGGTGIGTGNDNNNSNLMVCVKCKNCSTCKRSLEKKGVRCKRHPICTHFSKKQRLV